MTLEQALASHASVLPRAQAPASQVLPRAGQGDKWYVLAGISKYWVYICILCSGPGVCAKGQLGVQQLVDCDCSVTDTFWNY